MADTSIDLFTSDGACYDLRAGHISSLVTLGYP
jgi:hypothetical protein